MSQGITVTFNGPIFDNLDALISQWHDSATEIVATKVLSTVQQKMDANFKNPTPYYETQVTMDGYGAERTVHDRGIVYGPWLEGTGSRNATTSFKGYHHWRDTARDIENDSALWTQLGNDLARALNG